MPVFEQPLAELCNWYYVSLPAKRTPEKLIYPCFIDLNWYPQIQIYYICNLTTHYGKQNNGPVLMFII